MTYTSSHAGVGKDILSKHWYRKERAGLANEEIQYPEMMLRFEVLRLP